MENGYTLLHVLLPDGRADSLSALDGKIDHLKDCRKLLCTP
jgi:hypothetical protein